MSTATATMALPGSPTLTNPDMILPYGEYESAPSPSPSQHPYRPSSPGGNWREPPDLQFSLGPPRMGSVTPTTPIIYGNGTMLSDIGEVTEAESTPRRGLPGPAERRMLKQAQNLNSPIKSSPTTGYQAGMRRAKSGSHLRKVSSESASTVKSEGQPTELFRDFDDVVSVDDTNFQGDDEESLADSYSEGIIAQETMRLSQRESIILDEDHIGSAALSMRAEEILLNAKKRLNNMEGNLTKARSSLFITPSKSMSSIHSSSPLTRAASSSPHNERIIAGPGAHPSQHRQLQIGSGVITGSPGHSRIYSENSISAPLRGERFPVRAASAAARYVGKGGTNGNQHIQSASSGSEDTREGSTTPSRLTYSSPPAKASPPHAATLESLSEDPTTPEFDADRTSVRSSVNGGYFSPDGDRSLSRSSSSMQMRDLQTQMHGLKGRLSVLRDRARDDTMKRRSLQSLRTPSPFTAAEQWYTAANGYGEEPLSADAGVVHPPWNGPEDEHAEEDNLSEKLDAADQEISKEVIEYADSDVTSVYEDVPEGHPVTGVLPQSDDLSTPEEENTRSHENDTHHIIDAKDDYSGEHADVDEADDSESDVSLYHDSYDTVISHEDREDAFDYEHFFLHSAMGSLSQQVLHRRGSLSSVGSEDSVETTRGPAAKVTDNTKRISKQSLGHGRSGSAISMSTIQTFATAEEEQEENGTTQHGNNDFAVQQVEASTRRGSTPLTAKRETFGGSPMDLVFPDSDQVTSEKSRPTSVVSETKERNGTTSHRLSTSSSGSTRSFPLVNKPKHRSSTPPSIRVSGGSVPSSDATTLVGRHSAISDEKLRTSPVHMLAKEDQLLVEGLVASLGKCVLGLQEAGRGGNSDSTMWRGRLETARRVLEGRHYAL